MRGLTQAEYEFLLDSCTVYGEVDLYAEWGDDADPKLLAVGDELIRRGLVEERYLLGPCYCSVMPGEAVKGEEDVYPYDYITPLGRLALQCHVSISTLTM